MIFYVIASEISFAEFCLTEFKWRPRVAQLNYMSYDLVFKFGVQI